ncbi:MAG: PAS domain S-box protein [Burkholderiaceae bacterium]
MSTRQNTDKPDFRAFYNGLPMAVLLLDDEFRVADLNTAFELGLDFTRDEIVGRTLASLTDDENATHLVAASVQMAQGSLTHSIVNCRITSRNGRRFDSVVHLSVLSVDQDRRYLAMFQSLDEISERERLLLSQSEMFRVTIEQSPLPMSIQDHRFRFVMVNRAYCEFTGYSQAELIGRDAVDFLHPSDVSGTLHEQRKLVTAHGLQQLSRFSLRRELIHRNGRRLPYRIEVGRSRGLDGQPLWVAVLIDLTKQERRSRPGGAAAMRERGSGPCRRWAHDAGQPGTVADAGPAGEQTAQPTGGRPVRGARYLGGHRQGDAGTGRWSGTGAAARGRAARQARRSAPALRPAGAPRRCPAPGPGPVADAERCQCAARAIRPVAPLDR